MKLQRESSLVSSEKDGRVKKSTILFQSKESKGLKKIDGSHGYFQDPSLIFRPPCCFLKLDDDPPLAQKDAQGVARADHHLTQRSFWILDTCVECRWIDQQHRSKKAMLGFGYLADLFHGCTQDTISQRGVEVIALLDARSRNEFTNSTLSLPAESPLSRGGLGYHIRQLSRKIQSREFWDIQFLESYEEPFVLELHIKAFGNQQ
jgi:hypothetical protein